MRLGGSLRRRGMVGYVAGQEDGSVTDARCPRVCHITVTLCHALITVCHAPCAWKPVTPVSAHCRPRKWRSLQKSSSSTRSRHKVTSSCSLLSSVHCHCGLYSAMLTSLFSIVALLSLAAQRAGAQVVVNGQIFTFGLAIIDAPQPET